MKLGLWNIDHPEWRPKASRTLWRFNEISAYLGRQSCDALILTEANAALTMTGYHTYFSAPSPYHNKSRNDDPPNHYHQVALYSQKPCSQLAVTEPINGLLGQTVWQNEPLYIYGNVITIKDQWDKTSAKKYADRLQEQLDAIAQLPKQRCLIAGDFNLRLGWSQKKSAYKALQAFVQQHGWVWPTENQTDTVQHLLHSADLTAEFTIDSTIQHSKGKRDRLSDHPFISVTNTAGSQPSDRLEITSLFWKLRSLFKHPAIP